MFNNREEEAKREKDPERKAKSALLVAANKGRDQPGPSHPRLGLKSPPRPAPGPCFRCNQSGPWAKACPNPWPPTKACPTCGQWGYWKMDCPQGCPGTPVEVPISQTWRVECPQGCPGASGEIPTSPQNPSPTLRELFQCWGPDSSPLACVPNTSLELRVEGVVAGKKTSFIVDTGAAFSLLTSYSGPTQDSELTVKGSLEFP